jgi:DNA-binding response OmpR family regulator
MNDSAITGKKILVVEDEAPLRNALHDMLEVAHFTVLEAKDGQEGLDLALKEKPEVILLDLVMPVMDGMTMLKKLREDKEYGANVPVIVLSNVGVFDERVTKGVNPANPSFYLVKANWPIEGVVNKVKTILSNIEVRRSNAREREKEVDAGMITID